MASIIKSVLSKVTGVAKSAYDALANYKVGTSEVSLPIDLEQETV